MTRRFSLHFLIAFLLSIGLPACGGGSTSPSSDQVADFITGILASDGSVASRQSGAPPAANGGPTLTATSSGSVSSGGTDVVSLRASSPIQTVYVSINGSTGYYQLPLVAATTTITVTDQLASSLPKSSYMASYRASAPGSGGLVGDPTTVTNSVTSPTGGGGGGGGGSFTGTWGQGGTAVWVLTQSGSSVSGTNVFPAITGLPSGFVATESGTISGTVSGSTLTATNIITINESFTGFTANCTETSPFTATISGNTMTGTYTSGNLNCSSNLAGFPTTIVGGVSNGPFTLTKQ